MGRTEFVEAWTCHRCGNALVSVKAPSGLGSLHPMCCFCGTVRSASATAVRVTTISAEDWEAIQEAEAEE